MKADIAKIVLGLAEYYDKTLTASQLEMYVEDLSEMQVGELLVAAKKYRIDPNHKFFPLPGQLIAMVAPHIDEKDIANDVTNRIITAVGKYGHSNPGGAEWFVGPLAWEVVQRTGGWRHLCENLNATNEGIYRAQFRDFAIVVGKLAMRGELENKPSLPSQASLVNNIKANIVGFDEASKHDANKLRQLVSKTFAEKK